MTKRQSSKHRKQQKKELANRKKRKTQLRIVCAWCGKTMGYKDGQGVTGDTHSICPECEAKQTKPISPARRAFQDV